MSVRMDRPSRSKKRLAAMKRNPRDGWTIHDVVFLCRAFVLICIPPANGSHYVVGRPRIKGLLTIPAHRPIKPVHVMLLVQLVERALEIEGFE